MNPVQEHMNTLGIDYSIQKLTEYIYEYERKKKNSFPTQSVTIKVRQLIDSRTANTPTEKFGEFAGAGIEPTTFCMLGRRPNY